MSVAAQQPVAAPAGAGKRGETQDPADAINGAVGDRVVPVDDHSVSLRLESRDHIAMF